MPMGLNPEKSRVGERLGIQVRTAGSSREGDGPGGAVGTFHYCQGTSGFGIFELTGGADFCGVGNEQTSARIAASR